MSSSGASNITEEKDEINQSEKGESKGEVKNEAKSDVKGQIQTKTEEKGEIKSEAKGQSKGEVKNETKSDVKSQTQIKDEEKGELKIEVKGQSKSETKGQAKSEAKCQNKSEAKNQTKDEARGELKNASKGHTKNEVRGQDKGEIKGEGKGQAKAEAKTEMKNESKSETKVEVKGEISSEAKGQTKSETRGELKNEVKNDIKGEIKGEGKGQAKAEVKTEMKSESKVEVKGEISSEAKDQTKNEARGELKNEVKNEIKNDIKGEVKGEGKGQAKAETKLPPRTKSDNHPGTSSVGNLRFINDELRSHVTKLRNQLEMEKGNLKQAHRQKVLEIKNVREQEQKKTLASIIELKKKFHEEKTRELENSKETLMQKFETEKLKAVKLKDTEMLKVKQELDVKEKMLNKLLAQSNANRSTSSDTGKTKLLDELSELRSTKRQLEESLSQATVVEKHHSENLRKLCDSYETELVRIRRDSHLEIRQLMSDDTVLLFVLGDTLPTNYDVAIAIFSICQKPESEKMKQCIHSYVAALRKIWIHAFGEEHVADRHTVRDKVKQVINHYKTHVYNEKNRTKPKKKGTPFVKKGSRVLHQEWRQMSMSLTKNRQKYSIPINSLCNCGKDLDGLTGIEKDFYVDQTGAREGRISESIDDDYVTQKNDELAKAERDKVEEQHALGEIEEDDVLNESDAVDDGQLNISLNHSGHVRSTASTTEIGIQCDFVGARPKIRNTRNCTNEAKSTCAEVSVNCNISNQKARVAFQTVCSSYYGHEFYLTKEEAIEKDPDLEELRSESSTSPTPPKRSKSKEKSSIPHTTDKLFH